MNKRNIGCMQLPDGRWVCLMPDRKMRGAFPDRMREVFGERLTEGK